jgi:hypothetical protein
MAEMEAMKPLTRADLDKVKEQIDSWGPFPKHAESVKYMPQTTSGQRAMAIEAAKHTGPASLAPLLQAIIADLEQAEACIAVLQSIPR